MRRGGLYALFFLSGVSALTYELAWQRLLHLVFGVSTLAVAAVLAAYMGGLALGGLLFGRRADRTTRPLRLYAAVEVCLGLSALLVPPGFALLTRWYTGLWTAVHPGPWGGLGLRCGLALLVLGIPATLIGATLPIMARLACRPRDSFAGSFSLLYAVNTLGAVFGAALTGFVLLHHLGLRSTLWLASGVNLLVAGTAWFAALLPGEPPGLSRRDEPAGSPVSADRRWRWLALAGAALTGLAGMGFEVLWARILGILTSNSAYGFALLLTVLLAGLAAGGLLQSWWARRPGDPWRRLALCQAGLTVVVLAGISCLQNTPAWLVHSSLRGDVAGMFAGELALTAAAVFVPAVFMGMTLPLLVAGIVQTPFRFAWVGRVHAANSLGCVAGPFLVGFILIPCLGIHATLGLLLAVSTLVGLTAWGLAARPGPRLRGLAAVLLLAGVGAGWSFLPWQYTKSPVQQPRRLLCYREGNNATVAVFEEANGSRCILVDGQPVAGTSRTSAVDQKMLAHLPLLLHPHPRRALTVGFGSGGTSHSMTLHGIDVDCVEIETAVAGAATLFRSENHGVLGHPRFRLILDDARSWLRVAPLRYDAIVTDCTNLQYRSNGDLYTTDYFRLMKGRLEEGGLAAAWVPANGIREDDLKTLLRSFRAVFPHTSVWYVNVLPTDFLIVVGTPQPLQIDAEQLRERMQRPGVAEDLAAVDLTDPCRLLTTLLTAGQRLDDYLGEGPLNTDDRPVLSYATYGSACCNTIAANLLGLMSSRVNVAAYVRHAPAGAALLRCRAASSEALLGHIRYHLGDIRAALRHYLDGCQLLPEDQALRGLLYQTYASVRRQSGG